MIGLKLKGWQLSGLLAWQVGLELPGMVYHEQENRKIAAAELPTGTITFLFTDIEGSTRLWERAPEETLRAPAYHDEIVEHVVVGNGGFFHKARGEGDSQFAVFQGAAEAAAAAVEGTSRQGYADNIMERNRGKSEEGAQPAGSSTQNREGVRWDVLSGCER